MLTAEGPAHMSTLLPIEICKILSEESGKKEKAVELKKNTAALEGVKDIKMVRGASTGAGSG
jgi:hypothetical protein